MFQGWYSGNCAVALNMDNSNSIQLMAVRHNIQYINKDFTELRASLINYARTYFPTTYNDFTPASPGMMFMRWLLM